MSTVTINGVEIEVKESLTEYTRIPERVLSLDDVDRIHRFPSGTAERLLNLYNDTYKYGFPRKEVSLIPAEVYLMIMQPFRDAGAWYQKGRVILKYFQGKEEHCD